MTRRETHIPQECFRNTDIDGLVLYRCYGLDGTLMYIGQTENLRRRIKEHRCKSPWWSAVEHITVQFYRSHTVLRQDELRAITIEEPHFNKHGKGRNAVLAVALSDGRDGRSLWSDGNTFAVVRHDDE